MADSSFFGGVHNGIRTPETVMNSGPLPPLETGGLPYGLNGVPDAKINYNSSLLGDLDPYAYGGPSRLSTQSSYINIPNRIQKVVPELHLPGTSNSEPYFALSHAVDDGDICFAFRDRFFKSVRDRQALDKMYTQYNYHPFINLATVNYLLAGIQHWHTTDLEAQARGDEGPVNLHQALPDSWAVLVKNCFEGHEPNVRIAQDAEDGFITKQCLEVATRAVCKLFLPFGIAHGSERQGGGHEGTLNPVTWATNFVTTMYVDGHVRNLGNLWRGHDILAGDRLILTLKKVPVPREYVLNHYHKAMVRKMFNRHDNLNEIYQLVPEVETSSHEAFKMPTWHIAMAYSRSAAYMKGEDTTFHDDSTLLRGALLEASFQPNLITSGMEPEADARLIIQAQPKDEPAAKRVKADAGTDFTKFTRALCCKAPAPPQAMLGARAAPAVDSSAAVDAPPAPPEPAPAPSGKRSQKKKVQASVLGADAGAGGVTLGDVI